MSRVIHFEIHADDPAACARFYADVFGWKAREWPGMNYWLLDTGTGAGINGGVFARKGPRPEAGQPVNAYVCTIGSDDLDGDLRRALDAGAGLAVAKFAIPGVGWTAYFHDPFGNIVGLHQADPGAGT